jgi:hypothetical protein
MKQLLCAERIHRSPASSQENDGRSLTVRPEQRTGAVPHLGFFHRRVIEVNSQYFV